MLAGCSTLSAPHEREPDITIHISPTDDAALKIGVAVSGSESGTTRFTTNGSFGGTDVAAHWFRDFAVECASPCSSEIEAGEPAVTVSGSAGASLRLSYTLQNSEPLTDVDDYQPSTSAQSLHLFSPLTLLLPEELSTRDIVRIRIIWDGDTAIFGPFGVINGASEGILRGDELTNLLLSAGDDAAMLELGGSSFGAISFAPDLITADAVLARISPIVAEASQVFPESDDAWYFVTVQNAGPEIENGFALGGTAVRSAFALYASPSFDFENFAYVFDGIVAHEYFHNWNGVLFFVSGDEEHGARWFVEGFTDFYTRRLAHRAGVWTREQAQEHLNGQLSSFLDSPFQNAPLADIIELWETGSEQSDISYKRGDLIALAVDEEVRRASMGMRNLDDLMRHLASMARDDREPNVEDIFAWIESETSPTFASRIQRIVEDGGLIPLPAHVSEIDLQLSENGETYALID
ncbi:MAG: hypothetical protein AAF830_07960 [Pseudomonadota bacterium]